MIPEDVDMTTDRFVFPAFRFLREEDSLTHEIIFGELQSGGNLFLVKLIRSKVNSGLNFLIAEVSTIRGEILWRFKDANFAGIGLLAQSADECVIALVGKGRGGKMEQVIPFSTISEGKRPDLMASIQMKYQAAKFLGIDCQSSPSEQRVIAVLREREREAEIQARKEAEEKRDRERHEKIQRIISRPQIVGLTVDGKRRHGYPVTEHEWPSLSNGTFVILVTSYDDQKQVPGEMIESFEIWKGHGKNPSKKSRATVSYATTQQATGATMTRPEAVRTIIVEMKNGEFHEVHLYTSTDEIRRAREAGLNGGTYVAVNKKDGRGRYEVLSVHKDRVETIGPLVAIG